MDLSQNRQALLVIAGAAAFSVGMAACAGTKPPPALTPVEIAFAGTTRFLDSAKRTGHPIPVSRQAEIDTIRVDAERVEIHLNRAFSFAPFRTETVDTLYAELGRYFAGRLGDRDIRLYTLGAPVEELVPNMFRVGQARDSARLARPRSVVPPVVRRADALATPSRGLFGRHIALWHSHGWYYERSLDRWEWQRARVFTTVEDLLPMAFTVRYLAPMLENAGARVFFPRERDTQTHMVIVDNDDHGTSADDTLIWKTGAGPGFGTGPGIYEEGVNPFRLGTYRIARADSVPSAEIVWVPDLPETGDYAVYVSYAMSDSCVTDASYTVRHDGGNASFLVNQTMGGGTWIYLGTFRFRAGSDPVQASVVLTNESRQPGRWVTADAVRFGGGMGLIKRGGRTSGRPRFVEAARYHMQFAGMPDSLVYSLNAGVDDYRDDYQGRGEWVNYLRGAPFGPNGDRATRGLGVPIDVSLAFHTDAGISRSDTTIGTLAIYSLEGADTTRVFPDSVSRFANRDMTDIVQTQVVSDLSALWDPAWRRRGLWDAWYSEAYRPNVPSMLLELLSHHNFLDMKFALDPRFRFDVSRAVYKGILRFLATQHGHDFVVQPLPVTHLSATLEGNGIRVSWRPRTDELEPSAEPDGYIVFVRVEDAGFDSGRVVYDTTYVYGPLRSGAIYSFKVTAFNDGGESFPSEIVSAGSTGAGHPVLIVNGFDRVAGPATIEADGILGFAGFLDEGVPDRLDLNFTGAQYDFSAASPWTDDDSPGHGASHADCEQTVIAGNTFDYPYVHGASVMAAGRSFGSASDEAVWDGNVDLTSYETVDLILGEEKRTPSPKPGRDDAFEAIPALLRTALTEYLAGGGSLIVSGAYLGTDLYTVLDEDTVLNVFARNVLRILGRTDHASVGGQVLSADTAFAPRTFGVTFNTGPDRDYYVVESPDGIEPVDSTAATILRYAENGISAGVGYRGDYGVVALGFPFEAVRPRDARDELMRYALRYVRRGE